MVFHSDAFVLSQLDIHERVFQRGVQWREGTRELIRGADYSVRIRSLSFHLYRCLSHRFDLCNFGGSVCPFSLSCDVSLIVAVGGNSFLSVVRLCPDKYSSSL